MGIAVKRLPPVAGSNELSETKVKICGNIIETTNFKKLNHECYCVKLDKDHYYIKTDSVDYRTGELKELEYNHNENRLESYYSLLKSFAKLRDLINCNVTDVENVHWCTLTYAENMQDLKQLHIDFKNFWQRFKVYSKTNFGLNPEYISAVEPQERGAWHIHLLILWNCKAPFIPHYDLWKLWSPKGYKEKKDFVKIQSLYKDGKAIDNVGAYLTSYLTDTISEDEHKKQKHNRLKLYPNGMNLYRTSRNIKRPEIEYMYEAEARKKVSCAKLTFEKRILIEDKDKKYSNEITYKYYNSSDTKIQ